jgi:hypothetical protein
MNSPLSIQKSLDETTLKKTREQMLNRILDLQQATDEDHSVIEGNKRAYNEIVDQLSNLRQAPRFDPLEKLPLELWRDIIYLVVCPSSRHHLEDFSLNIDLHTVLTLTLVSGRWQEAILNTPLLWTCVSTRSIKQDSLIEAFICIELSRPLPITLCVSASLAHWHLFAPFITPHRERIHRIRMDFVDHRISSENPFSNFIKFLQPLPNLTSINIITHIDEAMLLWLFDTFPRLQNVGFCAFTSRLIEHEATTRVKFIYMQSNMIYPLVQKDTPLLEHLWIVSSLNPCSDQYQKAVGEIEAPNLEPLAWRTIKSRDLHSHFLWELVPRLINLVSLDILVTFSTLGDLLIRIHQFPMLKMLEISVQVPPYLDESFPLDTKVQSSQSIQNLNIHADLSEEEPDLCVPQNYKPLHKVISKCLASIKAMKVAWFDLSLPSQILQRDSFPLLEELDITIHRERRLESIKAVPSSVRQLKLRGLLQHWCELSSSSVEDLSLYESDIYDAKHLSFNHSKWTSLKRLSIDSKQLIEQPTSFSLVTELVLLTSTSREEAEDSSTTKFCKILALDPSQFPSLNSLVLSRFPEWDIFLIMLERRNLRYSGRVSPIEKIQLPSYYPRYLFSPIHDLLCGRFPTRPSSYDLSLAGNIAILGDNSM